MVLTGLLKLVGTDGLDNYFLRVVDVVNKDVDASFNVDNIWKIENIITQLCKCDKIDGAIYL